MISDTQTWRSRGKLLITGEYLVMEGALSLALPLCKGQSLSIKRNNSSILRWQAKLSDGIWFNAEYQLPSVSIITTDNISLAQKLMDILVAAKNIDNSFLSDGVDVITTLEFNPEFGFGTSSTLISNIAMWAKIDPYLLLKNTFGGSGYDIACAGSQNPILYRLIDNTVDVTNIEFNPPFKNRLYFVYLGKKQSSSEEIAFFKKHAKYTQNEIDTISNITRKLVITKDLNEFEKLITEHEKIMSGILGLLTVKSQFFNDHTGAVKSLGAWGGDFVLVTNQGSKDDFQDYMKNKGINTIYSYESLVL